MPPKPKRAKRASNRSEPLASSEINSPGNVRAPGVGDDPVFTIRIDSSSRKKANNNKRKHEEIDPDNESDDNPYDSKLTYNYTVLVNDEAGHWDKIKKYKKFIVGTSKLSIGDIVYVKTPDSAPSPELSDDAEDDDDASDAGESKTRKGQIRDWVAKVLDCRAQDEEHVFLRVIWLYRPEDLATGRQSYHSFDEVIPSNDMQIIDAMTVNGPVQKLEHWDESDDKAPLEGYTDLIWRQTFDVRTQKLSPLRKYCICKKYANPNQPLIQCKNPRCKIKWMHTECIEKAAIELASEPKEDAEPTGDVEAEPEPNGEAAASDHNEPTVDGDEIIVSPKKGLVETVTSLFGPRHPAKANGEGVAPPALGFPTATAVMQKASDIVGIAGAVTEPAQRYTAKVRGLDSKGLDTKVCVEVTDHVEDVTRQEPIHCLWCEVMVD